MKQNCSLILYSFACPFPVAEYGHIKTNVSWIIPRDIKVIYVKTKNTFYHTYRPVEVFRQEKQLSCVQNDETMQAKTGTNAADLP